MSPYFQPKLFSKPSQLLLMCNDSLIRRFAGVFVLLSVGLGYWVHPAWFLFTALVGATLLLASNPAALKRAMETG